jgi:hypothetical protein
VDLSERDPNPSVNTLLPRKTHTRHGRKLPTIDSRYLFALISRRATAPKECIFRSRLLLLSSTFTVPLRSHFIMSFIRRRSKKESRVGGILKQNNKPNLARRSPSLSTLPVSGGSPRISSPKVVKLDAILHSFQTKLPVRSTSLTVSGIPGARPKKKSLVWKNIEIRQYERVCGDNPSCSSGVPLS